MSTGVFQFSPPERHHPTETLKTVRFGVSNAPGGLLGPEISRVEGWPSWPSACPVKLLKGGWPTTQRAHASVAPNTKPDHDMHGGPAGRVHIFLNTKVTVFSRVLLCTQLTCRCAASNDCVHAVTQNMEAAVRA